MTLRLSPLHRRYVHSENEAIGEDAEESVCGKSVGRVERRTVVFNNQLVVIGILPHEEIEHLTLLAVVFRDVTEQSIERSENVSPYALRHLTGICEDVYCPDHHIDISTVCLWRHGELNTFWEGV